MKIKFIILIATFAFFACKTQNEQKTTNTNYSAEGKIVTIYTTAKDTSLKLTQTGQSEFEKAIQPLETEVAVFVNPNKSFQTFLGIGGAITDASSEVFAKLSEAKQQELLDAYYSKDGISYSLVRTSIHSCDFGSGSFTYNEEGD
ncbi:MAG: glycosyl hydrolase, partial [Bacteroidales bacterium]|nr:glycosyl hydrolase [Bacteroidales bacterium]